MDANFVVGDKVRISKDNGMVGKTGVIIKDGGRTNLGFRKLGEGEYNTWLQQWVVKINDTGDELNLFEGSLEKIS
jgi:hypothetical protein